MFYKKVFCLAFARKYPKGTPSFKRKYSAEIHLLQGICKKIFFPEAVKLGEFYKVAE
jgi:hypothetical protein